MTDFATIADLKEHLNITSGSNDQELFLMLAAAEDVVVSLVGDFAQATVTESVTPSAGTIILRGRPAGDVTIVDGYGAPVTGFWVDGPAGLIRNVWPNHHQFYPGPANVSSFTHWPVPPLKVTYQTRATGVPAAVGLATLIIAGHLWETQRGSSPSQVLQGDTPEYQPGLGFAVPNRARELLAPYISTSPLIA